MTLEERRTHMWQAIVRRVFTLNDDKQRAQWLQCFAQSICSYVDNPIFTSPKPTCSGFKGQIGNRCLLTCAYSIGPERAQFDILQPELYVQYGIDSTVFTCAVGKNETVDDVTEDDIACVLRGMVEHPRQHVHFFEDIIRHELRVGTGLAEPYLFLFQLRFQLCLDPTRRAREIARLQAILTPGWFQRRDSVAPSHLFGLR